MKALAQETTTEEKKRRPRLRAIALDMTNQKLVKAIEAEPGKSKQVTEKDPLTKLARSRQVIEPPFNLFVLSTLPERNTELGPCIEAMETNIDGFGHRLISRVKTDHKDAPKELKEKVQAEKTRLDNFFLYAGMEDSFRQLRRNTRKDLESTGNGYWEVIRDARGEIQYFAHMKSYQVRLTPQEPDAVQAEMPFLKVNRDGSFEIEKRTVYKRFRRYVQSRTVTRTGYTETGYQTRWFKAFGDPRAYDCESGEPIPKDKLPDYPVEKLANEVIHFKLYSPRSPYGLPRYIGTLLDIEGDRKASEVNYVTLSNNNIPSIVILTNGVLTEGTIERLKEFFQGLQGDDNRAKALIIEAESASESEEGESPEGQVKVSIERLKDQQQTDAMFIEYSKQNKLNVRVSFRLPHLLIGRSEEYNRATAEVSRRIADEQIFAPERDEFDSFVNRILFPMMGVIYHQFKSNSPNTTDNTELVRILGGSEKTGGMTPRIARHNVLEDILGIELPPFDPKKFDPDIPFSLTMAEAVKNLGVAAGADKTEPGQTITALKGLKAILGEGAAGEDVIEALMVLRKQLEEKWSAEVGSEEEEDETGNEGES